MISELNIEQYRGIKALSLNNLGKINIIAGANNCGKTSILEVIKSLESPNNVRAWRFFSRREGNSMRASTSVYDTMKSLFPMTSDNERKKVCYHGIYNDEKFQVELTAKFIETIVTEEQLTGMNYSRRMMRDEHEEEEYETAAMLIDYKVNDAICGKDVLYGIQKGFPKDEVEQIKVIVRNVQYISPTQHAQNNLFLNALMTDAELYEQFVDIMKEFDPGFISINSVEEEKTLGRKYVVLSKEHKEGLLLNAYGDGMKKAMLLLSAVLKAKSGNAIAQCCTKGKKWHFIA